MIYKKQSSRTITHGHILKIDRLHYPVPQHYYLCNYYDNEVAYGLTIGFQTNGTGQTNRFSVTLQS